MWAGAVVLGAAAVAGLTQHIDWLFILALVTACAALVILVVAGVPDLLRLLKGRWQAAPDDVTERPSRSSPAFTHRWRHTTDGIEVPGMSMTLQKRLSHPGYMTGGPGGTPPAVRLGVRVACYPLGGTPGSSELRDHFLAFLGQAPVRPFITELTSVGEDVPMIVEFGGDLQGDHRLEQ